MFSKIEFRRSSNWRNDRPVLVFQVHSVAAVGVVRSLGRAGYPIHAASPDPNAIGLHSRYATRSVVTPPYSHPEFLQWLRHYIATNSIAAIEPSGILQLFRPYFDEFLPYLPIARDQQSVYSCLTKYDVFRRLMDGTGDSRVSKNLPDTLLVKSTTTIDQTRLANLRYPIFLKVDSVYSVTGKPSDVVPAKNFNDAWSHIDDLLMHYNRITIQEFVPGQGAAVAFVIWPDQIRAEFMNLCLHEVPHRGGFCSLRASWYHPEVLEDARLKIAHLGWRGVAMLEYRFDRDTGKFYFIELNARFWAALHVALYSRADLPRLLMDAFFGHTEPQIPYEIGVKSRFTFPHEIGYVLSMWRDPEVPSLRRLSSLIEFFLLFFDPRIQSDFYFPGDRGLYWRQLVRTPMHFLGRV